MPRVALWSTAVCLAVACYWQSCQSLPSSLLDTSSFQALFISQMPRVIRRPGLLPHDVRFPSALAAQSPRRAILMPETGAHRTRAYPTFSQPHATGLLSAGLAITCVVVAAVFHVARPRATGRQALVSFAAPGPQAPLLLPNSAVYAERGQQPLLAALYCSPTSSSLALIYTPGVIAPNVVDDSRDYPSMSGHRFLVAMAAATGDKNGKQSKGNLKGSPQKPKSTDVQLQKVKQAKPDKKSPGKAVLRSFASSRTVLVTGCPKGTSLADLGALFPSAVSITLLPKYPSGPFSGTCLVDFRGAAEASAAAGRQGLKVKGQPVFAVLAGTSGEEVRVRAHHAISPIELDAALPGSTPRPVSSPTASDPGSKGAPSNPKTKPKVLPARSPSPRGVQLESEPEELQGTLLPSRVPSASPGAVGNKTKAATAPQHRSPSPTTLQSTPTPTDLDKPLTAPASSVTVKQGDKDTRKDGINNRTVLLSGCPASTTAEELHTQFPTAESIVRLNNSVDGKPDARFLLQFPSVAEAEAMSQLEGLGVKGKVVQTTLMRKGRKEEPMTPARPKQASMADAASGDLTALKIEPVSWTVVFSNCPNSTTEVELQSLFPTAEAVTLVPKWPGGPFSGRCSLRFTSVAEVESVVSHQLTVKGQVVQAYVAEDEAVVNRDGLDVKGAVVPKTLQQAGQKELLEQIRHVPLKKPTWPPKAATEGGSEGSKKEAFSARTVLLRGCPPSTTEAELSALFPTAESIILKLKWWPGGPFSGRCAVRFATAAEAEAVAKRPGVIVQGQVVSARVEGDAAFEQLRKQRTLILSGCPPNTTAELLHTLFPSVESIGLQKDKEGLFNGNCFLVFPTAEEAMKVASTGKLLVKEVVVRTRLQRTPEKKGTESTTLKAKPTSNSHEVATVSERGQNGAERDLPSAELQKGRSAARKVLLCFPKATTLAALRKQFPAARVVVMLPRWENGPLGNRCLLVFPTAGEAEAVIRKPLSINGQTVFVTREDADPRTIIVSNFPHSVTEAEVAALLPTAEWISIELAPTSPEGPPAVRCAVCFPTVAEAEAAAAQQGLMLNGQQLVLSRPVDKASFKKERRRTLVLPRCPPSTTAEEVRALFPTAETVVQTPGGEAGGADFQLRFRTATVAAMVVNRPVVVNGQTVIPRRPWQKAKKTKSNDDHIPSSITSIKSEEPARNLSASADPEVS